MCPAIFFPTQAVQSELKAFLLYDPYVLVVSKVYSVTDRHKVIYTMQFSDEITWETAIGLLI